jgi:hypothetical protein
LHGDEFVGNWRYIKQIPSNTAPREVAGSLKWGGLLFLDSRRGSA